MKHKLVSFGTLVAVLLTASTSAFAGGDVCQVNGIMMTLVSLLDDGKVGEAKEFAKEQSEVLAEKIKNGDFKKKEKLLLIQMRNQLLIIAATKDLAKQKKATKMFGVYAGDFAKSILGGGEEPEEEPKLQAEAVGPAKASTTH